MMGIAQKVSREFSDAVRSRGQSYFAKGRVVITAATAGEISARVRGTAKYRVRLRLRNGRLHVACSCPYFTPTGDPCKHVWATILMADARGLLQSAPMRPLKLVSDVPRRAPGAPLDNGQGGPPHPQPQPHERGSAREGPGYGYRPQGYGPQGSNYGPQGTNYGPQGTSNYGPRSPGQGYGPRPGPGQPAPAQGQGRPPKRANSKKDRRGRAQTPPQGAGPTGVPWVANRERERGRTPVKGDKTRVKPVNRGTKRLLVYVLDVPSSLSQNQVVIDLYRRQRRPGGDWGPLKPWWHSPGSVQAKYDPEDRELLTLLEEAQAPSAAAAAAAASSPLAAATALLNGTTPPPGPVDSVGTRRYVLRPERSLIVEKLARSSRLRLKRTEGEDDPPTMRWDDGAPWRFGLDVRAELGGKRWSWRGALRRSEPKPDRMDLAEPLVLLPGLLILGVGRAARFDDVGVTSWILRLRQEKEIVFAEPQQDIMLARLLGEARVSPSELIDTIQFEEIDTRPRPCLTLRTPRQNWGAAADKLLAELEFDYDGAVIPAGRTTPLAVSTEHGLVIRRDTTTEHSADILLFEMGFRESKDPRVEPGTMELPAKRAPVVSRELAAAGWRVEAEGKLIRSAGEFKLSVTTGIDWFELDGHVDYGGATIPLPDLLAAARRGETTVTLSDGSVGMLPEEWIKKYGLLVDLGTEEDGHIRFGSAQAGVLDALVDAQPEIRVDAGFEKVRQSLTKFEGVVSLEAPSGFHGELRPYQCEGLGWLDYLQRFGFGGILADDMGLGKTVQVLAFLQRRRSRRQSKGPTLAIVPRSLVFNWIAEAEKFTPRLRVLDYTGPGRHALRADFPLYDLIITTYGTLRTDIAELTQIDFDYLILDEAQAIKNADSQAAKAARLLPGRHRLAMSGTPIENHLGELWSIFEFLNPGMLGSNPVFKKHTSAASTLDDADRGLLAKALRPFILRRTKSQVVKDLPEKTEQTLHCDMEPAQRKVYEQLRAHYRTALLRKENAELNRSKIEVLEALLRLRQAACHPGLIDPTVTGDPSAKLDMLLPQIAEVVEEGHKALVFSQFTSFLAIVRDRLDQEGLTYEYLDGRTRNRAERVERFQTDPNCGIFLISLKAGGLGLNLTAAEYVYLLDPWWNPAVEAQAIDRSHRIGQTQRVFAYRLICRDTVEEKILELQQRKRDLADAILNADNRVISNLSREDLEFLLS
jgi:superfamily II DNA or RNA helicase